MLTEWHFDYLCSFTSCCGMICHNYPDFGILWRNLGYFAWGCECSSGLFWKPGPCASRKTPAAIPPPRAGYAYSQLLVYMGMTYSVIVQCTDCVVFPEFLLTVFMFLVKQYHKWRCVDRDSEMTLQGWRQQKLKNGCSLMKWHVRTIRGRWHDCFSLYLVSHCLSSSCRNS